MPVNSWIIGGIAFVTLIIYQFRGTTTTCETEAKPMDKKPIDIPRLTGRRIRKSRKYWTHEKDN